MRPCFVNVSLRRPERIGLVRKDHVLWILKLIELFPPNLFGAVIGHVWTGSNCQIEFVSQTACENVEWGGRRTFYAPTHLLIRY